MPKFQVRVTKIPTNIVALVKSLRLVANLGLKDAKDLADYLRTKLPCVLVAGIEQDVADHVVGILGAAGGAATAEESSLSDPVLLCPAANQRYQWHWLAGPRVT